MSCNQNCGCGCQSCGCTSLIDSIANALNNLFPTYCNNCGRGNNNGGNQRNSGCGCQRNNGCGCQNNGTSPANILNNTMFVNLFGGRGQSGCGCNQNSCGCNQCGCGSNADLTALTACGNQCYDDYYAQQYALYPYNLPSNSCCCY